MFNIENEPKPQPETTHDSNVDIIKDKGKGK